MKINELKSKIKSKTININKEIVMLYSDDNSYFLCFQYINAIKDCLNKKLIFIKSIKEIQLNNFIDNNNYIYILNQEEVKETIKNIPNLIVVTKKIEYPETIEFPKLLDWQIADYITYQLPGLKENEKTWLLKVCNNNMYKLNNEIKKIKIFNNNKYSAIFNYFYEDNLYSNLTTFNIFDFTNSIVKKNIKKTCQIMKKFKYINIESVSIIAILNKQFLNIVMIQDNPKITSESLNISYKQFQAIKYNCGIYTSKQLYSIIEFLSSFDTELKKGNLDMTNEQLVYYIVCKIFSF